jgi:hypothetical protein
MAEMSDGFDSLSQDELSRDNRLIHAYQASHAHLEYIYRRFKELESMRDQVHDHTRVLDELVNKVNSLFKTVVHDNGTAVLSRLAKLELQFAAFLDQCKICQGRQAECDEVLDTINLDGTRSEIGVRTELASLRKMIEGYIDTQQRSLDQARANRWSMWTAIVPTIVAAVLSVIIAVFGLG